MNEMIYIPKDEHRNHEPKEIFTYRIHFELKEIRQNVRIYL